jgi:hypothetical protein
MGKIRADPEIWAILADIRQEIRNEKTRKKWAAAHYTLTGYEFRRDLPFMIAAIDAVG